MATSPSKSRASAGHSSQGQLMPLLERSGPDTAIDRLKAQGMGASPLSRVRPLLVEPLLKLSL
jgi:hypothetical protein